MRIPFYTSSSHSSTKKLHRRKGGGGGGRGGGGGGGKSSSSGSKGSGGSKGSSKGSNGSKGSSGGPRGSSSSSNGGGIPTVIPAGQLFAGRQVGGGTRAQIFGTRTYGSGYPGITGRGVTGLGFPFVFWPIVWPVIIGGAIGIGAGSYLHRTDEYGLPSNNSRPGGPMVFVTLPSATTNTTFQLVSDNSTVTSLITDISSNCTVLLSSQPSQLNSFSDNSTGNPAPEQVVQYYRASSISLTLEGYNNTAIFGADGTPDIPLPQNIDTNLLNCLNATIANTAPLVGSASGLYQHPTQIGIQFALVYVLWTFFGQLF